MHEESNDIEKSISIIEDQKSIQASELENKQMHTQTVFNKLERVSNDVQWQQDEKNWNVVQLSTRQGLLKDLQALTEGRLKMTAKSMEVTKDLIKAEREKANNLQNICDRLSEDFPQVAPSLRAVSRALGGRGQNNGQEGGRVAEKS